MGHRSSAKTIAVLTVAMFGMAACGSSGVATSGEDAENLDPDKLMISGVPAEEGTDLSNTYDPVIAMLEDETGKEVEFEPSTNYSSVIEGQRTGKVHIAQYGPLAYYQAKKSGSKVDVLAAMVTDKGGSTGYKSYGIVPKDSDIKDLKGFAGKKVCFVDESSTSGYLYPRQGLQQAGVKDGDWDEQLAGGHDASAIQVANGDCDAGFALDTMVDETLIDKGDLKKSDLKIVWKSDTIAEAPITVFGGLKPELKKKLTDAFTKKANQDYLVKHGYCDKGDCDLTDQRVWGWGKVSEDNYDGLVEVCESTKIPACNEEE